MLFHCVYYVGDRNRLLFAGLHVFNCDCAVGEFLFADYADIRDRQRVGICHLFFHFGGVGIEFGGDSGSAECLYGFERGHGFVFSEVEENNLHARAYAFGEKVEAEQHVVDSVGAKRYAHARHAGKAEHAGKVVVAAAS